MLQLQTESDCNAGLHQLNTSRLDLIGLSWIKLLLQEALIGWVGCGILLIPVVTAAGIDPPEKADLGELSASSCCFFTGAVEFLLETFSELIRSTVFTRLWNPNLSERACHSFQSISFNIKYKSNSINPVSQSTFSTAKPSHSRINETIQLSKDNQIFKWIQLIINRWIWNMLNSIHEQLSQPVKWNGR